MIRRLLSIGLIVFMAMVGFAMTTAAEVSIGQIPPELARWRSWVLHGQEEALCPKVYNDGTVAHCRWPTQLTVNVQDNGGWFEQNWLMFAKGWVALPGNMDMWPDGVTVNGAAIAVVNRENQPSVYLSPGEHHIKGRFYWARMPEMMPVPPSVGLMSLTVDGQKVNAPVIDAKGRLWLQGRQTQTDQQDRLNVRIFRLVEDTIPMRITTLVRLDVSGRTREIHLKKIPFQNMVPMALTSRLPARLSADGDLLIQARPGRWQVRLLGRMPGPVNKISADTSLYGNEVWSFQPKHHLRMVEIEGAPQVEPGQTDLPKEWTAYSAYLVQSGTTLQLKEIRRGDPDPAPDQLKLFRRWWLDFDGSGFTLQDTIEGTLSRQWHLVMNSPLILGRVSVDGKDQVITEQGGKEKFGIELRTGRLNLKSEARLPNWSDAISPVGWDHNFKKVSAELYLPPGWRLAAAIGVDQVSDTWLQRWSLLDFFLVLIIALAVFKLRGGRWGMLALVTMVLLYHEPDAPRLVWLHILAVLALLPLLPENWVKRAVSFWGIAAVITLLVISIPFAVQQVRWGFYPQLAHHNDWPDSSEPERRARKPLAQNAMEMEDKLSGKAKTRIKNMRAYASMPLNVPEEDKAVLHQDPDALIPTGPGLPEWRWHKINLKWNGPVAKDQRMHLVLLPPWVNLGLAVLRVLLLSLFIWGVFDWKAWWYQLQHKFDPGKSLAAIVFLWIGIQWVPAHATVDGAFPPKEMLETLRQRLLEPPDCLPYCADISRLDMSVSNDNLQIILKVHAADQTAIPLPVNRKSWAPEQILMDNAPISGLLRDRRGGLWTVMPSGLHTLVMLGNVAQEGIVHIPLPLKPHLASYTAKGWSVKGILPNGTVGSSIQLTRIQAKQSDKKFSRDNSALQPFLNVRRELHLGLTWQVRTTIDRVTPLGTPIVVNLPLLTDESLITAGLHTQQGHVLINMSADQRKVSFVSNLKVTPTIELTAPRAVPWTEQWVLDASPIWHCDLSGIAVVHHQDNEGQWQPKWQPWPGEAVKINVHRPKAMVGRVLTIQSAGLTLSPGRRFSRAELALKIRSSRGGQHTIELPVKANLQQVRVEGKSLPIRQDGRWVTIPLQPGSQSVNIQWHQLVPFQMWFKVPEIKIGKEAVNANLTIKMPQKRWILMTGGLRWGPAVLFWSYLAVIVLAALGLGRLPITPVKTWQWILLGLGMTQIPAPMALVIIGWLLALGLRERRTMPGYWLSFNFVQLGLILVTLLAFGCLFLAVRNGLIGHPDMQIQGNNSSSWVLNWTQDRINNSLPQPWVLSLPLWSYRGMMLVWSLWLACALLNWLKWGWRCFAKDRIWKKAPARAKKVVHSNAEHLKK